MDIDFLEQEISKNIAEYDKTMPGILREKKQHMDCLVRELNELPEERYHIHRRKQLQTKIKSIKDEIDKIESGVTKHNICKKSIQYIHSMQKSQFFRKFVDKTVKKPLLGKKTGTIVPKMQPSSSCVRNKTIKKSESQILLFITEHGNLYSSKWLDLRVS